MKNKTLLISLLIGSLSLGTVLAGVHQGTALSDIQANLFATQEATLAQATTTGSASDVDNFFNATLSAPRDVFVGESFTASVEVKRTGEVENHAVSSTGTWYSWVNPSARWSLAGDIHASSPVGPRWIPNSPRSHLKHENEYRKTAEFTCNSVGEATLDWEIEIGYKLLETSDIDHAGLFFDTGFDAYNNPISSAEKSFTELLAGVSGGKDKRMTLKAEATVNCVKAEEEEVPQTAVTVATSEATVIDYTQITPPIASNAFPLDFRGYTTELITRGTSSPCEICFQRTTRLLEAIQQVEDEADSVFEDEYEKYDTSTDAGAQEAIKAATEAQQQFVDSQMTQLIRLIDGLERCLENPECTEIPDEEQKELFTSTPVTAVSIPLSFPSSFRDAAEGLIVRTAASGCDECKEIAAHLRARIQSIHDNATASVNNASSADLDMALAIARIYIDAEISVGNDNEPSLESVLKLLEDCLAACVAGVDLTEYSYDFDDEDTETATRPSAPDASYDTDDEDTETAIRPSAPDASYDTDDEETEIGKRQEEDYAVYDTDDEETEAKSRYAFYDTDDDETESETREVLIVTADTTRAFGSNVKLENITKEMVTTAGEKGSRVTLDVALDVKTPGGKEGDTYTITTTSVDRYDGGYEEAGTDALSFTTNPDLNRGSDAKTFETANAAYDVNKYGLDETTTGEYNLYFELNTKAFSPFVTFVLVKNTRTGEQKVVPIYVGVTQEQAEREKREALAAQLEANKEASESIEEITVTGSPVKISDLESLTPMVSFCSDIYQQEMISYMTGVLNLNNNIQEALRITSENAENKCVSNLEEQKLSIIKNLEKIDSYFAVLNTDLKRQIVDAYQEELIEGSAFQALNIAKQKVLSGLPQTNTSTSAYAELSENQRALLKNLVSISPILNALSAEKQMEIIRKYQTQLAIHDNPGQALQEATDYVVEGKIPTTDPNVVRIEVGNDKDPLLVMAQLFTGMNEDELLGSGAEQEQDQGSVPSLTGSILNELVKENEDLKFSTAYEMSAYGNIDWKLYGAALIEYADLITKEDSTAGTLVDKTMYDHGFTLSSTTIDMMKSFDLTTVPQSYESCMASELTTCQYCKPPETGTKVEGSCKPLSFEDKKAFCESQFPELPEETFSPAISIPYHF